MSDVDAVRQIAADAGLNIDIQSASPLSGGCVSTVLRFDAEPHDIVAKLDSAADAAVLESEAASLRAIDDAGCVRTPRVLACGVAGGRAVLLMEHLPAAPPTDDAWARFGAALARQHRLAPDPPRYGFHVDNFLGGTPQTNGWRHDWVEFNATHRYGLQVRLNRDAGRLEPDEARTLDRLIDTLDRRLPRRPTIGLLHGDLWSGNALPVRGESGAPDIAVIDPACCYGDGWADIAMMQLFGGFPSVCFDAYRAEIGAIPDDLDARLALYQLYHLLNHLLLFGRGYAGQVMSVARRLTFG